MCRKFKVLNVKNQKPDVAESLNAGPESDPKLNLTVRQPDWDYFQICSLIIAAMVDVPIKF